MSLGDLIRQSFWESRGLTFPVKEFRQHPTMLTLEEMRMLYAIAAHRGLPSGDICDLGAFMGGSSISLAAGVVASGSERRVHSYDRFEFNAKSFGDYLDNHPRVDELRAVGYGVELYQSLTRNYAGVIDIHAGDFMMQTPPEQIAVCFVDLDKSFDLNRAVIGYFENLVPGAIIVQQDFFIPRTPWTAVTMHRLADIVPFRGATKANSALFEVTGELTNERLAHAVADGMTMTDVEDAYQHFIDISPRMYHREPLEAGLHRYRQEPTVTSTHDYGPFDGKAVLQRTACLEMKVSSSRV